MCGQRFLTFEEEDKKEFFIGSRIGCPEFLSGVENDVFYEFLLQDSEGEDLQTGS